MIERYIIHSEVTMVEERFTRNWVRGVGADAEFEQTSLGWFIYLRGSYEMLHVGFEKPSLKVGAKIKITIEEGWDVKSHDS